ncbi:hypothetical protein M422DRAFT_240011 [Sphaerobolus stellatus SS14]|nr:hypothetical protein M422DRAFT_240011 [Sphaerobolus stellatus SS14]
MSRFWSLFKMFPKFDLYHRFETSTIPNPWILGNFRTVIAFYGILSIIISLTVRSNPTPAQSFSYLSNIWWSITFYHIFASFHTMVFRHALNSVFAIFEIIFSRTDTPP